MGDNRSIFERKASRDWRGNQFFRVSLVVTMLSIVFFFAGRHFFPKLDWLTKTQWGQVGGVVFQQIDYSWESEPDGLFLNTFRPQLERVLYSVKGRPVLSVSLRQMNRELLQLGWLEKAEIRRVFPNRLEARLSARRPRLMVKTREAWAMTDDQGQLMIATKFLPGKFLHLPRVIGLESKLSGDLEEMNRRLTRERAWLQEVSTILHTLEVQASLRIEEVRVSENTWLGKAQFDLRADRYRLRLLSHDWKDRMLYLQFVLSDLKEKSGELIAEIDGRFPHKWFVRQVQDG